MIEEYEQYWIGKKSDKFVENHVQDNDLILYLPTLNLSRIGKKPREHAYTLYTSENGSIYRIDATCNTNCTCILEYRGNHFSQIRVECNSCYEAREASFTPLQKIAKN